MTARFLFKTKMQQQELAQMRQRDANLTALAAIGPRKKRKVDSPGPGSGAEVPQRPGTGWEGLGHLPPRLQAPGPPPGAPGRCLPSHLPGVCALHAPP